MAQLSPAFDILSDPHAESAQASPALRLPSLEELAARDETVKVTIALSKWTVDFFKQEAHARQTQYQRMIRRLLDDYVQQQLNCNQNG
jgi:predicted DNA binding CopG/RHH family protein